MSRSTLSVRPDTLDRDRFASALRESLFRKKLTQKELAHRLNVSQPTVSGWVNAQKTPGRDNLTRLVNELGLKAHEITTVQSLSDIMGPDDDALALPHVSVQSESSVAETIAPASVHEEAASTHEEAASGGNVGDESNPACSAPNDSANPASPATNASPRDDAFDDDPLAILLPDAVAANSSLHVDGYVVFSRTMLRQATQTDSDELLVMSVEGDSMAPDLPNGTSAMFSRIQRAGDHGLYVVLYDDALSVKTLQRFAGGALKLTAANPSYDAEMLMPTETDRRYRSRSTGLEVSLTILGKVVCYIRPV
jgi:phage repressor protein C with HTH and peptisase S24 domain/plasmid maintenance system antidote protein VapI